MALKRAEREKQLNSTLERDEPQRPRSARAARAALGGTVTLETPNVADQGNLAFRKSLAARLKAEVIGIAPLMGFLSETGTCQQGLCQWG